MHMRVHARTCAGMADEKAEEKNIFFLLFLSFLALQKADEGKRGAEKENEKEKDRRYSPFTAHFLLFFPLLSRAANFWYSFAFSFLSEKKKRRMEGKGWLQAQKARFFTEEKDGEEGMDGQGYPLFLLKKAHTLRLVSKITKNEEMQKWRKKKKSAAPGS